MRAALSFLTPLGGASRPTPAALAWFPVVGALLGLGLGALWWLAGHAWSGVVPAALVVAADLALTGLLHVDGLIDAADGLLPHLTPARRLEVMAEPTVGAFGVAACAVVLLLRFSALAVLAPAPLLLAGLWCASRTCMAVAALRVPYARPGGLAAAFVGDDSNAIPLGTLGLATAVVLAGLWRHGAPWVGTSAVLAGVTATALVVAFGRRRLGGFTGDVLGAAGLVGETVGLLVAAARW